MRLSCAPVSFLNYSALENSFSITVPTFVEIGNTVAEISEFVATGFSIKWKNSLDASYGITLSKLKITGKIGNLTQTQTYNRCVQFWLEILSRWKNIFRNRSALSSNLAGRSPLLLSIDGTDGQTPDRYIDPALHTMRAADARRCIVMRCVATLCVTKR